jgi:hypothetical protein
MKDSSYFRNGVLNNGEWTYEYSAVACLTEFRQISKFKLKRVYATKNTSMHSRHLWKYVQNLKAFFDLNNC